MKNTEIHLRNFVNRNVWIRTIQLESEKKKSRVQNIVKQPIHAMEVDNQEVFTSLTRCSNNNIDQILTETSNIENNTLVTR